MNLKFKEKLLVNLFLTGFKRNISMQYKPKLLKLLNFLKSIFNSNVLLSIDSFFSVYILFRNQIIINIVSEHDYAH